MYILATAGFLAACSTEHSESTVPPAQSLDSDGWSHGAMAATASPYATEAAEKMLRAGGHAVDAAIAAHLVLGLVEPQSSGIGGGGFMLVYQRESKDLSFHDGRELSPAGATVDMFMQGDDVMGFLDAWQSGKSVGVPGAVALYKLAHEEHGILPWPDLFQPAITLAEQGFEVSPRLSALLERMAPYTRLDENPDTAAYFYPDGVPLQPGVRRTNSEYASTLRRIAEEGIDAFYTGPIAQAIAAAAQADPLPGTLNLQDMAAYKPVTRDVVCGSADSKTGSVKICSASPPSSGAIQVMIANLYHQLDETYQDDPIRAFVDAQRMAYADRDHFFGDPDYVQIPIAGLLNQAYLRNRANNPPMPSATPQAGDPSAFEEPATARKLGPDTTEEASGTTHLSVVDLEGNAVSMTMTIEAPFGSSRWATGFLLNNELTDFARSYEKDGALPANAIGPNRRPRSSMSPTMIFDEADALFMVTGSPGGNSIPAYVAKTIVGVLDWELSAQEAADFPNIIARGEQVRVETGVGDGSSIAAMLKQQGYNVQEREGENSGIHLIVVRPDGLEGAADGRREGNVIYVPSRLTP
ncbi:MAG: gamma-glutamyltransferase family protein [Pseudomonadota bacterium]